MYCGACLQHGILAVLKSYGLYSVSCRALSCIGHGWSWFQ